MFMLRLAVRAACLDSSWYGPWDSVAAMQQLVSAKTWSSLLHALGAMLATFGAVLDWHYNANNIVSDILHVSRALFLLFCRWLWCTLQPKSPVSWCQAGHGVHICAQVFYSLSEWHTHVDFRRSDFEHSGLPDAAITVLWLVIKYADKLPRLHCEQASCADTALLMVNLSSRPRASSQPTPNACA